MSSSQPSAIPPTRRTLARSLVPALLLFVCLFVSAASAQAAATQWTMRTVPSVGHQGVFQGVSCTSPTSCIAVGWKKETAGSAPAPLAAAWNGEKWTLQTAPAPAGSTSAELTSVSCTSASACTAAGAYVPSGGKKRPFAVRWNGTSWTAQTMPALVASEEAMLYGVSCASATACVAVGVNRYVGYRAIAARWNGTSWALEEIEAPEAKGLWGTQLMTFTGISCTAANACTAVGSYRWPLGLTKLFAERWNGTAWTAQLPPAPEKAVDPNLEAISCQSATACTATGNSKNAAGVGSTLIEKWNGTSWTIQSTPNPSEGTVIGLPGVSCPLATSVCETVGTYRRPNFTSSPLAERFESSAWTLESPSKPEGPQATLRAISCPTATSCMVVGYDGSVPFTQTANRVNAPFATVNPSMTPLAPKTGSVVSTTNGTWTGEPDTFTYQWRRCSATTSECANIEGENISWYVPVAADLGKRLQVQVTAQNAAGKTTAWVMSFPVKEGP